MRRDVGKMHGLNVFVQKTTLAVAQKTNLIVERFRASFIDFA